MTVPRQEFTDLRAYIRASGELTGWITGARALALLNGADDCGVLEALRTKHTAQQIADVTNIDEKSVVDLCTALEAHGVVCREGEYYDLTPDYALLSSPAAAIPLSQVLHQAMVMMRALQTMAPFEIAYTASPGEDVLAMAAGAGVSALSSSPHVTAEMIGTAMPELAALWRSGGRHLEVGCGVGNSLFAIVIAYPKVTAVGIEINELTAAEAERRARVLGVSDRAEVRRMDACELRDEDAYDSIQWSQFFFPAATRPVVLRAMRRALKPGGYLLMPLLGPVSNGMPRARREMLRMALRALRSGGPSFLVYLSSLLGDTPGRRKQERRYKALNRLLFSRWGVPVGTEEDLQLELKDSGFTVVRTVPGTPSQFVLTRGLMLGRRPPV